MNSTTLVSHLNLNMGPSPLPERRWLPGPCPTQAGVWPSIAEALEKLSMRGRLRKCRGAFRVKEVFTECQTVARQWAGAHQVILPVGLRLPEMMKITRYVLYTKPNRTHCANHKMSCQHICDVREKVLAHFITLPLTPPLMQIFEMSKQIPQVPVGIKSNPLLTSG